MTDKSRTPPAALPDAPRWPGETFEAVLAAAARAEPVIDGPHGARHVIVPKEARLEAVPDPFALAPWPRAALTFDDRASLVTYVNRFSSPGSVLVADYDKGEIGARLDWYAGASDPAPCAHRAVLALRKSEEFERWDAFEGKLHGQAEFAAFLEENAVDVVDPEPAVLIEISRDLEAVQGVTFKSSTRLESGDRAFTYETETHVKGDLRVPREFRLEIPIHHGEAPVSLRCALRFKVTPQGLLLGFEWRRVEYQRRAHFAQIAHAVAEETGLPVMFGRVEQVQPGAR